MGIVSCWLPPISCDAELKKQFEHRVYASCLTGWGHFYMGLGALEEIDDISSCLAGNTESFRPSLSKARDRFHDARSSLQLTLDLCVEFRDRLPESDRRSLEPNITTIGLVVSLLEDAEHAIAMGGLPTLDCLHRISALIRDDMVFGERMARLNRGSHGHFPFAETIRASA